MNILTPEQIRAARALKNWSQSEFAYRTGLATPTIANIELGKQRPNNNTLKRIVETFKLAGVNFTERGVESTDNVISFIHGPEEYSYLMKDALLTLETGEEMLLIGADFRRVRPQTIKLREALLRKGVRMRVLMHEDSVFVQGPAKDHRLLKKEHCTYRETITIYKDKVATVIPLPDGKSNQLMVLKNQYMADDYRKNFKFMWDHASPIKNAKSVHDYNNPIFEKYSKAEIKHISET